MSAAASPAVAEVSTPAVADASKPTFRGRSLGTGTYYEFQWHTKWMSTGKIKTAQLGGPQYFTPPIQLTDQRVYAASTSARTTLAVQSI